jgi:solute carrier family 8 (sodium/calcium exchanger)
MALGSSCPEILLSIIEIVANKFQSGALGAGTIVGTSTLNTFKINDKF